MKRKSALLGLLFLMTASLSFAESKPMPSKTAIFAGGCFWCVEAAFAKLPGVTATEAGYTGGNTPDPTYRQVTTGQTGHAEAVRVSYDPARVTYRQLVDFFWRNIDPTVHNRQFCDVGSQYRTAIYWQSEEERVIVEESVAALKKSGRFPKIFTEIKPASTFYRAEDYHQGYYKTNAYDYNSYYQTCQREQRLKELWRER